MPFTSSDRFFDEDGHEVALRFNFDDTGLLTTVEIAEADEVRVLRPVFIRTAPRPSVDAETPLPLEIP